MWKKKIYRQYSSDSDSLPQSLCGLCVLCSMSIPRFISFGCWVFLNLFKPSEIKICSLFSRIVHLFWFHMQTWVFIFMFKGTLSSFFVSLVTLFFMECSSKRNTKIAVPQILFGIRHNWWYKNTYSLKKIRKLNIDVKLYFSKLGDSSVSMNTWELSFLIFSPLWLNDAQEIQSSEGNSSLSLRSRGWKEFYYQKMFLRHLL